MPHQTYRVLTCLGLVAWGDFAQLTTYKSRRGKVVWFPKTYPHCPPSAQQLADRAAWKAAVEDWKALPATKRAQWELATRRASLCCNGINLYLAYRLGHKQGAIDTIARQTQTDIP